MSNNIWPQTGPNESFLTFIYRFLTYESKLGNLARTLANDDCLPKHPRPEQVAKHRKKVHPIDADGLKTVMKAALLYERTWTQPGSNRPDQMLESIHA